MNEIKNFQDAFEENSQYSSIQNKEVLYDRKHAGNISYYVYGASECGLGRPKNGDNIYLNGLYMKSFQFSSYYKKIEIKGESALFATAGFTESDSWAKNIFDRLDKGCSRVHFFNKKTAINTTADFAARNVMLPSNMSSSYASLVVSDDGAAACAMGSANVFRFKGSRLSPIPGRTPKMYENIRTGVADGEKEDIYVLCSGGLLNVMSPESIGDKLMEVSDIELAVKEVIARGKSLSSNDDVSMIVVKAVRSKAPLGGLWKKIIAVIAAVSILVAGSCLIYKGVHAESNNSLTDVNNVMINY